VRPIHLTAPLTAVLLAWGAFAAVFLLRRREPARRSRRHRSGAWAAFAIQGLGYALVWDFPRPLSADFGPAEHVLRWCGAALAWGSVWIALSAVRALGAHWSLAARMIEGHRLVTEGPYRLVRHPIYAAMLGLLVATGINLSRWWALFAGLLVFLAGTWRRIAVEEALLREEFPDEFARYARAVPALLPWGAGGGEKP